MKPVALVDFEKERASLVSPTGGESLEGIFGALRVKGLKVGEGRFHARSPPPPPLSPFLSLCRVFFQVEKVENHGSVVYRVRTLDPLTEGSVRRSLYESACSMQWCQ